MKTLAESHGIQPSDQDRKEFVQKPGPLVNQAFSGTKKPGADHSKPVSLTVEKTGEEPFREAVKNWTGVRLGICSLMLKRNEEAFRQFVSNRPDWFLDAPSQYRQEIDQTGIFISTGANSSDLLITGGPPCLYRARDERRGAESDGRGSILLGTSTHPPTGERYQE